MLDLFPFFILNDIKSHNHLDRSLYLLSTMSQILSQATRIEGDINSDAVHKRLQQQTGILTCPICPICWETLCGFDAESRTEHAVVAWNGCGQYEGECYAMICSSPLTTTPLCGRSYVSSILHRSDSRDSSSQRGDLGGIPTYENREMRSVQ
jgi:hypothetical protein